jgi:hypothetical protein
MTSTLRLNAYPEPWVKLICGRCGRKGQYRKGTLIVEYGSDILLPDLLSKIARCDRAGKFQGCGARYENLIPPNEA